MRVSAINSKSPFGYPPSPAALVLITALLWQLTGCSGQDTPRITADVDECAQCRMVISRANEACGFMERGNFIPFDSPGCLLRKLEEYARRDGSDPESVWFADYTTARLVPADSVFFLITGHIETVMNSGVLTFEGETVAQSFVSHEDELVTDWRDFQTLRRSPDKVFNIEVSDEGFNPDVVLAGKNGIVEWRFTPVGLAVEVRFRLNGYDEFGEVLVSPGGDLVIRRLRCDKPGAGFPFLRIGDEQVLGQLKVHGAHTADEEAM